MERRVHSKKYRRRWGNNGDITMIFGERKRTISSLILVSWMLSMMLLSSLKEVDCGRAKASTSPLDFISYDARSTSASFTSFLGLPLP